MKGKIKLASHRATVTKAANKTTAWWYENKRSIEIYMEDDEYNVIACRINRKALKDWIERTEE